jgi:hypothetical protein
VKVYLTLTHRPLDHYTSVINFRTCVTDVMDTRDIRDLISSFLDGCNLVYPRRANDSKLEADCIAEAVQRQYITDKDQTLKRFIPAGVLIACNAYRHQRYDIQIFICLYTALLVYLDDVFEKDVELVRDFNYRFVTSRSHEDRMLNHLGKLLLEMPAMFGQVEANIMVTSTMNGLTSLLIEHEVRNIEVSIRAFHIIYVCA